jgi:hypothetical protein
VTEARVRFDTDVPGLWGLWPTMPELWSYSSLREIEACPRRWMLSRASYPDLWGRHGYPPLPVVATVFGNVVHAVVERITKELRKAGMTSPSAAYVVGLLGSLGGWKGIVLESVDHCLETFEGNPRISPERLGRVRDELIRRAPEAADQIKSFLGRGALPAAASYQSQRTPQDSDKPRPRYPAGPGTHTEREVTSEELRLTGRIDLLRIDDADVTVTDFKTGAADEDHDDQVRLYALLLDLDRQTNPCRRPATQLRVSYAGYERAVKPPTAEELRVLETATAARIQSADSITKDPGPRATPRESNCQSCQVKHLCDAYWSVMPPAVTEVSTEMWFDFEGRVVSRNGSRSWFLTSLGTPPSEVLVRTWSSDVLFPVGQRVRLLGVRRSQDPEDEQRLVISMVATSEWFALAR